MKGSLHYTLHSRAVLLKLCCVCVCVPQKVNKAPSLLLFVLVNEYRQKLNFLARTAAAHTHTHTGTLEWTRRTYTQTSARPLLSASIWLQFECHCLLWLYTSPPSPIINCLSALSCAANCARSFCVRSLRSCALSILLTPSRRLRLLALAYSVDSALCCRAVRSSPAITHRALHTHTHTHGWICIYLNSSVIYITVNAAKPTTWHNVEILWL